MADFDNTNRGTLGANERKTTEKHPDFKGQINVDGKEFWLSGWNRTGPKGSFISLSIEPKEARPGAATPTPAPMQSGPSKPAAGFSEMDDSIPF